MAQILRPRRVVACSGTLPFRGFLGALPFCFLRAMPAMIRRTAQDPRRTFPTHHCGENPIKAPNVWTGGDVDATSCIFWFQNGGIWQSLGRPFWNLRSSCCSGMHPEAPGRQSMVWGAPSTKGTVPADGGAAAHGMPETGRCSTAWMRIIRLVATRTRRHAGERGPRRHIGTV